jgi:hypothetical protein
MLAIAASDANMNRPPTDSVSASALQAVMNPFRALLRCSICEFPCLPPVKSLFDVDRLYNKPIGFKFHYALLQGMICLAELNVAKLLRLKICLHLRFAR